MHFETVLRSIKNHLQPSLAKVNLALCVAFMRRGVVNLAAAREKEARAGLLEFTALKLSVSCLTALGIAMLAESGCASDFQISTLLSKLQFGSSAVFAYI